MDYLSKEEAEKLAEMKLDGRRKYFMWDGLVCVEEKYTSGCTGCLPDDEYSCATRGGGCPECGYKGVRRNSFPCPVNPKQVR